MRKDMGLIFVAALFGILIGLIGYTIGYEHGFDDCWVEMRDNFTVRYSNID